jgi:hypothetical protein
MPEDHEMVLAPLDEKVDHVRGGPAGRLILEYGDYECPYSRQAFHAIEQVERQLGGTVRFAFRHFPLTSIHSPRRHDVSRPSWPVRHQEARAWPGIPAPARAASIQPVTWLCIGPEELVSQARTGAGVRQARCVASGVDRPAGPAVEAQRLHDRERRGGGEDLDVRGSQHAGVPRDDGRGRARWRCRGGLHLVVQGRAES